MLVTLFVNKKIHLFLKTLGQQGGKPIIFFSGAIFTYKLPISVEI